MPTVFRTRTALRRPLAARVLPALAATLIGCSLVNPLANGYLDIEATELQARLNPRFPVQQCKLLVACVELANPQLTLPEGGDRIHLLLDARLSLGTRERTGQIGLSARPRYAADEGQLFLDDLQITQLNFAGLPDEYAALLRQRAPSLVQGQLRAHPVYVINNATTRGTLARQLIKDVTVVDGKLRIRWTPKG